VTEVTLRRARPDEASMLSELALAAKEFWGYDQAFIESCRAELSFSPDDVARRHFVVADLGGMVAGFYSLDGQPPAGELGNMWVRPGEIGTGLGRVMWHDAMAAAAAAGFEYLEISAEPDAEGWHAPAGRRACGPRPLAQDGQIGTAPPVGANKTWDPADESLAGQPGRASADSEVRPGPRPPTLRPHHRKTVQAGPEALPTSSLPTRCTR
jgi:hypothetical protein